jgi:hypothetical protein
VNRESHEGIVNQAVDQAIAAMFPDGAGRATPARVEHHLRQIAHVAFEQGRLYALLNLLTVEDIAARFNVSTRRVRTLIAERHARLAIGYQITGTRQWLITPEEVESLRPGLVGRPRKSL